jgi:carbamoyltransferase
MIVGSMYLLWLCRKINILGISALYHDSAACLVKDGEIFSAAQEERFTYKKHDSQFPTNDIRYCMDSAGVEGQDLDDIAFMTPFI